MLDKFRPGHHVQLTVHTKTYIGQISFVNQSFDRIELKNVMHLMSATKMDVLKCYKKEITEIILLTDDAESSFTADQLMELGRMLNNFIFIDRFDVKYHNAIDDISEQSSIGLHIIGADKGRLSATSVIVISTESNIYLLDIIVAGRIEKRIKNILEANVPKKIVHDAEKVADNLKGHNVRLCGVFDTMIAHVSLGLDESAISLRDCLRFHLNIPVEFLEESTAAQFQRRPLSFDEKNNAAQHVMFLKKLHFKLTRTMLAEIYSLSARNVNLYISESP